MIVEDSGKRPRVLHVIKSVEVGVVRVGGGPQKLGFGRVRPLL